MELERLVSQLPEDVGEQVAPEIEKVLKTDDVEDFEKPLKTVENSSRNGERGPYQL